MNQDLLHYNYIPNLPPNNLALFFGTDSKEVYKENLKHFGNNWYWANKEITYQFNKHGYRMKEFNEVDYNNYTIYFGCSHTVGVGVPLEQTFAFKASQEVNLDYVNAAVCGSSPEFAYINFMKFIKHAVDAKKLPKAIVINWPNIHRTFFWGKGHTIMHYVPGADKFDCVENFNDTFATMLRQSSHWINKFNLIRNTVLWMSNKLKIPLLEITCEFWSKEYQDYKFKSFNYVPQPLNVFDDSRARDLNKNINYTSHPGPQTHQAICEYIVDWYKEVL